MGIETRTELSYRPGNDRVVSYLNERVAATLPQEEWATDTYLPLEISARSGGGG